MVTESEITRIANGWLAYCGSAEGTQERDELLPYWIEVKEIARDDPETAIIIISKIASKTKDDYVLSTLAAGPLEEVFAFHDHAAVELFRKYCKNDLKMRYILSFLWSDQIDDEVWKFIENLKIIKGPPL